MNRPLEIGRKLQETLKAIEERRAPQIKAAELAQKERELEIWRQAYNAALAGYEIQRIFFEKYNCELYSPVERADQALDFYRAKREEMGL